MNNPTPNAFGSSDLSPLIVIIWGSLSIALYFLPTIVAFKRKKANTTAIALVNLFLGWSVIGWIISLVWAVSRQMVDAAESTAAAPPLLASELCTKCGRYSPGGVRFCAHCGQAFN